MQKLEPLKALLGTPRKIVITTHQNPDADALGSSLGLSGYLLKNGHSVTVITPTGYPDFLCWMKGNDNVIIFNEQTESRVTKLVNEADLIFCLDFSSLTRINELGDLVRKSGADKVLIDHHLDPEDFAKYVLWSTEAAATAELVFGFIEMMGDSDKIDKDIAECLYAGIMTDTGSFRHSSTTEKVHKVVAELIAKGADVTKVSKLIYDNNSLNRLKFIGFALSKRLCILANQRVAYFLISKEDSRKFDLQPGDTEGLVNYGLSIKGIKMAAIIIEKGDIIKMSFRSIGDFSVNDFAQKHFNGGGHKNAAGGSSELSLQETEEKFLEAVRQGEEQLMV